MINVVVLVGRLASDPELKYTPSGLAVTTFRLAVDRRPNSEGVKEADFFSIVTWKQQAEFAANYLNKGRLVAINGRLQARSWVAQDGSKRNTVEVVAHDLRSLERPKERTEGPPAGAPPEEIPPAVEEAGVGAPAEDFDPFADE